MNARRCHDLLTLRLCAGVAALLVASASRAEPIEREWNAWPFLVQQRNAAGAVASWTGAGPLLFRQPQADPDGNTARGFRPIWVRVETPAGDFRSATFLYPLFSYSVDENTYKWSLFELVRQWGRRTGAGPLRSTFEEREEFEVFPFWFSRQTGDPELSYRGLFPIHGTVKHKLWFERLSWTLFPLYVENEKRGAVTTSTPWPIVRVTRGAAHGWGVWPLFNYVDRPGVARHETYLWPLGFNHIRHPSPDDPPGTPPRRDFGLLPFYTRSTGPGYVNEDYLWPFFGYTDQTRKEGGGLLGSSRQPGAERTVNYRETRYLWPFFVQGRGDERMVDRWAPFYTHSIHQGYDKRWFLWPLLRRAEWTDDHVARERTQLLYFLYWREEQRALRHQAPAGSLTHVWPLFSHWENGAGRRQWQFLSPLEVFFPQAEKVKQNWSPLFALARHERRGPGDARTSLLWNAITWERQAAEQRSEFHLGPLLGVARRSAERRIAIGNGLFGFKRDAGRGWRMFWWDFPAKRAAAQPLPPAP